MKTGPLSQASPNPTSPSNPPLNPKSFLLNNNSLTNSMTDRSNQPLTKKDAPSIYSPTSLKKGITFDSDPHGVTTLKTNLVISDPSGHSVKFINYDEKEEATCIKRIEFLQESKLMLYLAVPLLSICTAFIFALFLFWY